MKLTDFKAREALKPPEEVRHPARMVGKRQIIREDADPWDLESLEADLCPTCAGDLTRRPSPSGNKNITYFECKKNPEHVFVQIIAPKDLATGHQQVIFAAHTNQTLQLDAAVERSNLTLVDHMGRFTD